MHRLSPELASSALMLRELKLYRQSCACTRRVQARARLLHENLDRVIVFDLRFRWWGLGNNLNRWLTLLRLGLASGRAVFLWFSGGRSGSSGGSTAFFDLGVYFRADGFDWRWDTRAEARVRLALNLSEPTRLYHKCLRSGIACERHEMHELSNGRGVRRVGTEEEERNGSLLQLLTLHPSRWLMVVPVRPGQMTAFQPSAKAASAVLSGQAGGAWGAGWDISGREATEQRTVSRARAEGTAGTQDASDESDGDGDGEAWAGSCWNAHNASARARDATYRSGTFPSEVADAMGATELGPLSNGRRVAIRNRQASKCEAFSFLRPRRKLQQMLAPVLRNLDALHAERGRVCGVHVRTGYPDWVALASLPNGSATSAWRQAAAVEAGALTYSSQWKLLEGYLDECTAAPSKDTVPCFSWRHPFPGRAPTAADVPRLCGARSADVNGSLHLPGNRTLAAVVLCATRLGGVSSGPNSPAGKPTAVGVHTSRNTVRAFSASHHASHLPAARGAGHVRPSGLLVLGDAPGVVSLLREHPQLQVVHTSLTGGALGHTQFDAACAADCARHTPDPQGGWSRTVLDFYLGGLSDAFVSALDSTFLDGAVLQRSLSCCAAGSRMHLGAASNAATNRDRPMGHVGFLKVLMHEATPPRERELGEGVGSR